MLEGGVDFESIPDPLAAVDGFRARAEEAGLALPECMTLATVDERGYPRARVVLLKARRGRNFEFYSNYESKKAQELSRQPHAALCIHYPSLALQARVEGKVSKLSAEESDAYFATRPRDSQIGAWASQQSRPLKSREELDAAFSEQEARFLGKPVPRPPHWGGYALVAQSVELWIGRGGRLHDRAQFTYEDGVWVCQRLFP